MKKSSDKTAEYHEVTLAKAITHKGKEKKAGDKIAVTADIKQWLAERGIIATPETAAKN
ncbi:MAG: hypothetical protein OEZ16_12455 [Chromatiales bacterium]|nr:hypothetical protein [Chromatiales bacterium]